MKRRALAVVLTLMMLVSVLPMAAYAAKFSDTVGHWAESSIDRWTDEGVLQGVGDNMFLPNAFITRAQASAVFTRLMELTDVADISRFTDLEPGSWYVTGDYVAHAVAYGIFNGTSATTFNPDGFITRQDFFLTLVRALGIPEQDYCYNTTLQDLDQISAYARGAVYALINLGYVNGRSATELQPLAYITRAEVAKVLDNVISSYITNDGTYQVSGDKVAVVLAPSVALSGPFSGTIVAGAENGTIDLSGVNTPVKINAIRKNVTIKNAPAQSVVNSEAEGTQVNGTPVNEDNGYTVPGEQQPSQPTTGGGGGGGGGGGATAYYDVTMSIDLGSFTAEPIILFASFQASDNRSIDDAFKELAGIGKNNNATRNKGILEDGMYELLQKFDGETTYGDYTVTMYAPVNAKDTADIFIEDAGGDFTATDYNAFLSELDTTFNNQRDAAIKSVSASYSGTNAVYQKWVAFTNTFKPSSQLTVVSSGADAYLATMTASQYVEQLQAAVNAWIEFRAVAGTTFAYDKLFNAENTALVWLIGNQPFATVLKSQTLSQACKAVFADGVPLTVLWTDTSGASFTDDFMTGVVDVTVADYTNGNGAAAAAWYSAFMNGHASGEFEVDLLIEQNSR